MKIGIVGGLDRNARELEQLARADGHELGLHTGVVAGAASADGLRALVARSDLVVILTDINSHNGVQIARRQARLRKRPFKMMRRLSVSQFAAFLQGVHLPSATA
jgi:hypothetical protein